MTTATAPTTAPPSLNILATYDPAAALKSDVRWKRVWQVATVILPIAYAALAILALCIVTTLWPAHTPIASIILLAGGAPATTSIFLYMLGKVEHYKKQALTNQELNERFKLISTKELNETLNQLGFSSSAEISVQKTLLARYQFFEKRAVPPENRPSQVDLYIKGQTRTINPDDYQMGKVNFKVPTQVEIFNALQQHNVRRIGQAITAALNHLQAAHALYLIQNPEDTRGIDEIVKPTTDDPLHHLIAQYQLSRFAYTLIQTEEGQSYGKDRILSQSAAALAHEIFGLKLNGKDPFPIKKIPAIRKKKYRLII